MRSVELLERNFELSPPSPRDCGRITTITLRLGNGVHRLVEQGELSIEQGLIGDRWFASEKRKRHSQITMINATVSSLIAHDERPGWQSGDNLGVALDLSEENLPAGTRLQLGDAILEITAQPHRGCSKFSARFGAEVWEWVNLAHNLPLRLRGLHCEVIAGGRVRIGDPVVVLRSAPA